MPTDIVHGQLIRELRKQQGWNNAQDFADMLDIDKNHLYGIEQGNRIPSLPLLVKIADLLSISACLLINQQAPVEIDSLMENMLTLSRGQTAKLLVGGITLEVPMQLTETILKTVISFNAPS